uniref:Uncharacterized protein n=1 Tax=Oryza meridionalis TaxID=40149 RepID=A0A0E0CY99_9ORYZ
MGPAPLPSRAASLTLPFRSEAPRAEEEVARVASRGGGARLGAGGALVQPAAEADAKAGSGTRGWAGSRRARRQPWRRDGSVGEAGVAERRAAVSTRWGRAACAAPGARCRRLLSRRSPPLSRRNREGELHRVLLAFHSIVARREGCIADCRQAVLAIISFPFHILLTMPKISPFDFILYRAKINGNATVSSPALGRALRDAVVTSSPFPSFWTKSSRATTPPVSPHHRDQNPSRTMENEALWTEIGIIFSNSYCRLPSLIPPHPVSHCLIPRAYTILVTSLTSWTHIHARSWSRLSCHRHPGDSYRRRQCPSFAKSSSGLSKPQSIFS